MAAITSADGTVKIGSNTIGEVTGFSLEIASDTVESTAIDDTDRTYLPGLRQSTISIDANFDPDVSTGIAELEVNKPGDALATFEVDPNGSTAFSGSGIVTGFTITAATNEMVTASITIQISGALTETYFQ